MSYLLKHWGWVLWSAGVAVADPPSFTWHYPAGGQQGQTIGVSMDYKADLESLRVWSESEYLQVTKPSKKGEPFVVSIAAEAPAGASWIRLIDAQGVSQARQFVIGNSTERQEKEPNGSHVDYDLVTEASPITINGKLDKRGDVDAFAWDLETRQWLVIDVDANVLDSPIDPMLRMVDVNGNQLAFNHDSDDGGLDPELAFQAPAKGRYVLLLSGFEYPPKADSRFAGGERVIYRLHASHELKRHDMSAYFDQEPNQSFESALSLSDGQSLGGTLSEPGDEDWYRFIPPEKDHTYQVLVDAQALGSKIDGWLEIRDGDGKVLMSSDDSGRHTSPDPVVIWKSPNRDPHFVVVRDIRRHGGQRFHYQLSINQAKPNADLTVSQDRWTISQGASVEIKVAVARAHGHDLPITIQTSGLPDGLTCESVTVAPDKKEALLTIKASEDAALQSRPLVLRTDHQSVRHDYKGTAADAGALFLNKINTLWLTVLGKAD